MEIVNSIARLRAAVSGWRHAGQRIALVPTMGALHAGHLSLVERARVSAQRVVVSIFVNPRQFAPGEDFGRYPRQLAADSALLETIGADLLFAPTPDEVYPAGYATSIRVSGLDQPMEGASRPGHFDGVATVVAKLLMMSAPDIAVFGEKDWQQLAIIRRMVKDLNLPVEIDGAPIIRDADGLAMSSRNAYLSADERARAAALPAAMRETSAAIASGADPDSAIGAALEKLAAAGFVTDYLTLADAESLGEAVAGRPARLFAAARIGNTRLIDNWRVGEG